MPLCRRVRLLGLTKEIAASQSSKRGVKMLVDPPAEAAILRYRRLLKKGK